VQANRIPPLPNPCVLEEAALYQYFAQPLQTEALDIYPRKRSKIATPKPIKSLYKIFSDCTPEQKYLSALRLLQGWNDSAISAENKSKASLELNALSILEKKDKPLFKKFCDRVVTEAVEKTMRELYQNLDRELAKRIRATLLENYRKIACENLAEMLEQEFVQHELLLNNISVPSKNTSTVFYTMNPGSSHGPILHDKQCQITVPVQNDIVMEPHETAYLNFSIQLFLPHQYYAEFRPTGSALDIAMYQQCEVSNTGSNDTVKMLIKDISSEWKIIPSGTHVLAVYILRKCDRERASASANSTSLSATALELESSPLSHLHLFIRKHCPNSVTNLELNTTMMFPEPEHKREDVLKSVWAVNFPTERGMRTGDETPILDKLHSKDTVVRDFTTEIMAHKKDIELNYTLTEDQRRKFDHPADQEDVRQALLRKMCERLAVIGIDFLQNQSISRSVFASAQKSDDYLSVIYESVRAGTGVLIYCTRNCKTEC
jgi:hypothetical protein